MSDASAIGSKRSLEGILADAEAKGAGMWTPAMQKEVAFQQKKRSDRKVDAYFDKTLLSDEIGADLHATAAESKSHRDKNQRARERKDLQDEAAQTRARPALQDLLRKGSTVFVEPSVLQDCPPTKLAALGLRMVARREEAAAFVSLDAAAPGQRCRWVAALTGGLLLSQDFVEHAGAKGVCFARMRATSIKREIWASDSFRAAHGELWDIVVACAGQPGSSWTILGSLEAFRAARLRAAKAKRPRTVLCLIVLDESSQQDCAHTSMFCVNH